MNHKLALFLAIFLPFQAALPQTSSAGDAARTTELGKFAPFFPAFSWDRVPVYQMFADNERLLTDQEVAEISSTTGFLCIEKQHGMKALGAAELGAKHEIARFKALKPKTKGLFYFNSAFAYPFTTYSKVFGTDQIEEPYRSFLIMDPKTGKPARRGRECFFDVLNPQFRTWWAETVGKGVRDSGADGVFVDQMHGFVNLRPTKGNEVNKAQAEMMRMAKRAIGPDKILLLNNAAESPELFAIGDAFMFEHYATHRLSKENILVEWELMKKISQTGKASVWRIGVEVEAREGAPAGKQQHMTDAESEELSKKRISYYLAAFLIGAQPQSYFQYGWGWGLKTGPLARYPEFQKPLGKPLGEYRRPDPNGWVFQREFEHASVFVDLEKKTAKIDWK
jgi:hypothetical protein